MLLLLAIAAAAQTGKDFVKGADVGFLQGQERRGVVFHDRNGRERECLELLKNDYQLSAIRMRVWVDPRGGDCDKFALLAMAKRVKALDMDLMVDFHYSDSWADPGKQPIPKAWRGHTFEQIKQDLRQHTVEVLSLLRDNGIEPRWVQVGNETSNGLLWDMGHIDKNPQQYAGFIRAGYDAVKEVFPRAIVIVHLDRGHRQSLYDSNLDTILQHGGKFDMVGMSLYPYWAMEGHPELNADDIITDCIKNIRHVSEKYQCDVMIVETGYEVDEQHPEKMEEGRRQLARVVSEARNETGGHCRGVFYWEPQCLPGGYKLGAFDSKAAPTAIMDGFIENKQPLHPAPGQAQRRGFQREAFTTETPMVHDPVMAFDGDTYYIYATGVGIQRLTSKDRRTWTVLPQPVMSVIPGWTTDSVPGFGSHVWAPDVIQWHGRWWLAYSCSTFGKNGSAIGLLSSRSLRSNMWKDEGCIVASHERKRGADGQTTGDNWNAIDPNFVIDDEDTPWLVWGSFWDGIQLARLDSTMHIAPGEQPSTIARRYDPGYKPSEPNPTSKYAGTNAIEAPFIFKHGGYYYLFVSWDYCCRGTKSNYRVAVGRSRNVAGPYLDREGKDMARGGGTLVIEGDKKEWEAAGHCAAYTFGGEDIFVCHGYSATRNGAAMLIQRPISWTADGWPRIDN